MKYVKSTKFLDVRSAKYRVKARGLISGTGLAIIFMMLTLVVTSLNSSSTEAETGLSVSGQLAFNSVPAATRPGYDTFVCLPHAITGESGGCTSTIDSNGNFSVGNVASGDYGFTVYRHYASNSSAPSSEEGGEPDNYSITSYETVVSVGSTNITHNLSFTTNKLTVSILNLDGSPAPNAGIVTIRQTEEAAAPVVDSDGHTYNANDIEDRDPVGADGTVTSSVFPGTTYTVCLTRQPLVSGEYCARNITVNSDTSTQIVLTPVANNLNIAASPTRFPSLDWTGGAPDGTFNIYRDGELIGSSGTHDFIDTGAPEGSHNYEVLAISANGVASSRPSNTDGVTVDITPPSVTGIPTWSTNPLALGSNTTLTVTGDDALTGVARAEYFISSDPGKGNATPIDSSLSVSFGSNLTVGVYNVGVRIGDAAGNWSAVTTTMLVVYDASAPQSITGKNKKDLVPSLSRGDILPGLTSANQTSAADYGMTASYKNGALDNRSAFKFDYLTGSQCGKPSATNCHNLNLTSTAITWLLISSTNNSQGQFQGTASLTVDGVTTTNPFVVTGFDGSRLTPPTGDTLELKIYGTDAEPNTASPIYKASGVMAQNNSVKIR